jgi:hypothetical protein
VSFLSSLASLFVPEPVNTRALAFPDLETQLENLWQRKLANPIRIPGVNEALGVPAIFGAVSLIADTAGSLSLEAFRNGSILPRRIRRASGNGLTRSARRARSSATRRTTKPPAGSSGGGLPRATLTG